MTVRGTLSSGKPLVGEIVGVVNPKRRDDGMLNITPDDPLPVALCRHRHKTFTLDRGWRCTDCKAKVESNILL